MRKTTIGKYPIPAFLADPKFFKSKTATPLGAWLFVLSPIPHGIGERG